MQKDSKFFEDVAKLTSGAAASLQAIREALINAA